jgi:hypothetical protein
MLQRLFKRFIVTLFDFSTPTHDEHEGERGCRSSVALRQFDTLVCGDQRVTCDYHSIYAHGGYATTSQFLCPGQILR